MKMFLSIVTLLFAYNIQTKAQGTTSSSKNQSEENQIKTEEVASFPGGSDALSTFLKENTKYPAEAIKQNIEGTVYVKFIINREGGITNIEVVRSVHPLLDEEAKRVVKSMPNWEPGKQRGVPILVSQTLPINFVLESTKKKKKKK